MILSVTLNPALDHTIRTDGLNPHDTNRIQSSATDAGGKGINLSRIVSELGGQTVATGFLGGSTGEFIRQVMRAQGVRDEFVSIAHETRTNFNVESGDGPPTTFNAKGAEVTELEWNSLVSRFESLCRSATWVALGGSIPPGAPPDAFATLGQVAKASGARLVLDADGDAMRLGLTAHPDFVKPNAKEAERLLGRHIGTETADVALAAKDLFGQLSGSKAPDPVVVISRGARGAILCCNAGLYEAQPIPIEARSTIGSGDSLIGGMLTALENGLDVPTALAWGNAAGAATALTDGSEIGRREVIQELLERSAVEKID